MKTPKQRKIKAWAVVGENGYPTMQLGYCKGPRESVKSYWYYFENFQTSKDAERRIKEINRFERPEYKVVPIIITLPTKKKKR